MITVKSYDTEKKWKYIFFFLWSFGEESIEQLND